MINTVLNYCQDKFPNVVFSGGSSIHASRADGIFLTNCRLEERGKILNYLLKCGGIETLMEDTFDFFHQVHWFFDKSDVQMLVLKDIVACLASKSETQAGGVNKLNNPVTGNTFHRVAMFGDLVCGIRGWVVEASAIDNKPTLSIGLRFRLERTTETEKKHRAVTEETLLESEKEIEAMCQLLEIAEPPKRQRSSGVRETE